MNILKKKKKKSSYFDQTYSMRCFKFPPLKKFVFYFLFKKKTNYE